jgi:hypothetical protein
VLQQQLGHPTLLCKAPGAERGFPWGATDELAAPAQQLVTAPAPAVALGSRIASRFAEHGLQADEQIDERRGTPARPAAFD